MQSIVLFFSNTHTMKTSYIIIGSFFALGITTGIVSASIDTITERNERMERSIEKSLRYMEEARIDACGLYGIHAARCYEGKGKDCEIMDTLAMDYEELYMEEITEGCKPEATNMEEEPEAMETMEADTVDGVAENKENRVTNESDPLYFDDQLQP